MKIVAIGVSTGGPGIIEKIVTSIHKPFNGAIVICLHMAHPFLEKFVKRLQTLTSWPVILIQQNQPLQKGVFYLCNGNFNTLYRQKNKEEHLLLEETSHTPNIDTFFNSLTQKDPRDILAIILSGIGEDGVQGLGRLYKRGVYTLASDEASSIVYGMPKRAKEAGYACEILSLEEIISKIEEFLNG